MHIRTVIPVLLGLLLLSHATRAQQVFRKFKVTHWDSRTGMPNDISLNIYQTNDGFIWLSGYSGLIRFDGASFAIFNTRTDTTFKSDGISSIITQTPDSALWIPTPGSGLIRYKNGRLRSFVRHKTNLSVLGNNNSNELVLGTGAAEREIILFNYQDFQYRLLDRRQSDSVIALWRSTDQINWYSPFNAFRGSTSGDVRIDDIRISLPYDSSLFSLNSVLKDSKGRIWAGTQLSIMLIENGKKIPAPGLENETIIPSGINRSMILEDNEGGIWIGTRNGLAYLPEGAARFTFYDGGGTVKLNNVQAMLKDSEGNIWAATDKGLFKFSPSKVINYTEQDGLVNTRLASITETEPGKFILATRDNRLYRFSGDTIRPIPADLQDFLNTRKEIYFLYTDRKKQLWVACNGVLFRIGPNSRKKWEISHQFRYVTEGNDGRIYFAVTGMGVGYIDQQDSLKYLSFPGVDFTANFVSAVKQRKNGEWVLTSYGAGILIGKPGEKPRIYKTVKGVGGIQVFGMYEDKDGHLWFPTAKGMAVIRNGKDSLEVLDNEDGMPFSSSFEVLEDQFGYFWLPTNLGVIKVKREELLAHLGDRSKPVNWKVLDEGDGIVNQQFVGARHPIIGSDQRLYFPNISGLVIINPGEIKTNTDKPKLAINGILIDNRYYPPDSAIIVSPGDHRYIVSYSAMSFLAPEKVKIKFRLVGYDRDWIISQGDRRAIYTNLPPGEHVFEMIAANNDGVWADEPVRLSFTVKPFFYQTEWFSILSLLGLLGMVWAIVRWRTSATRRQNQELEALVAKRTQQLSEQKSEIEQALHQLKGTQAQLIQSEKMASLGELTAGIAHEIQNPLNFVNNFSELNKELIGELQEELKKGDIREATSIAENLKDNEEKINLHGRRADGIVKSMLQHSRASGGQKEPTDINKLVDEYTRLAYHGFRARNKDFNVKLDIDLDPNLPLLPVVAQDIGRVILNLLNNAFQAVQEKAKTAGKDYQPTVTVSIKARFPEDVPSHADDPGLGPKGHPHGNHLSSIFIAIEDNGSGIPDAIKDKIFQPFFTTKPTGQGTGLGLSLSYDIVKAHSGELQVQSQEGEGTIFTMLIPANS
jgi:signal transduction histidine kinase/ligand-binding sensor domain-containing protein